MFLIGKEVSQIEDMYKDEENSCKLLRLLDTLIPYTFIGDKANSSSPFIKKYNSLVAEVRVYLTYIEDIHQESSKRIKVPSLNDLMINIDTLENVCTPFKASDPNAILYAILSSIMVLKDTFQEFIDGVASANVVLEQKSAIATGSSTVWMTGDTSVKAAVKQEPMIPADMTGYCSTIEQGVASVDFYPEYRKKDISDLLICLDKSFTRNILVLGGAGVGKTSLIQHILSNSSLKAMSISFLGVISNTRYRGEAEARIRKAFELAKNHGLAIFLEDIHMYYGYAGLANCILGAMKDFKVNTIAECSWGGFFTSLSDDEVFLSKFQVHEVLPLNDNQVKAIILKRLEAHKYIKSVSVTSRTVNSTISLIQQYNPDEPLVGKCLDVFDTLLTRAAISGKKNVVVSDVTDFMNVKDLKKLSLTEVRSLINNRIYGQSDAVESILRCIETYLCRLNSPKKPIGSFLMTGQTGTGKTELAKAVASALGFDMIKFNMSDYSEQHSISGLIGSKSGYVGYEEGGALTNALKQYPRCVLLLDEVEKAHPDIYNIFLNMIDEGYIKDSKDNYVSCANVIIIMTTNLSAAAEMKKSIGFYEKTISLADKMLEIKKFFRPEFLARLTDVISFRPISSETCDDIAHKFLYLLSKRNSDLNISFTAALTSIVAQRGFVEQVGGRSMLHYIDKNVMPVLCDFILKNRSCKRITIDYLDGAIVAYKSP